MIWKSGVTNILQAPRISLAAGAQILLLSFKPVSSSVCGSLLLMSDRQQGWYWLAGLSYSYKQHPRAPGTSAATQQPLSATLSQHLLKQLGWTEREEVKQEKKEKGVSAL